LAASIPTANTVTFRRPYGSSYSVTIRRKQRRGFLGAGEKDVAVPFEAVHPTMKDKKWWLVMNTTKDSLKSAPGFKYDSDTTTWVPDRR
jgi:hypothetical protein